jgi:hypothetical protein
MTVWRKPVRLSFLTSCCISTLSPNAPEGFVIIVGLSVRLIGLAATKLYWDFHGDHRYR